MLVDEILGPLVSKWTAQGLGWAFDEVLMTCLAYADDVLLFADSLEKLVCMFNDCCASFERAGLAVGAEKTHWSSTVVLNGMLMRAGEHDVLWERTFTFVGCELEPSGHSGGALAHRIVKANGVFSAWRPILLNPNIPLRARAEAFGISVASSLLWQAGNWTLTESELSRFGLLGRSEAVCHVVQEAEPEPLHWRTLETAAPCGARNGGDAFRWIFVKKPWKSNIASLVTLHVSNLVPSLFAVLSLRDLAWWRRQQKDFAKLKDKWHGLHPQKIQLLALGDSF